MTPAQREGDAHKTMGNGSFHGPHRTDQVAVTTWGAKGFPQLPPREAAQRQTSSPEEYGRAAPLPHRFISDGCTAHNGAHAASAAAWRRAAGVTSQRGQVVPVWMGVGVQVGLNTPTDMHACTNQHDLVPHRPFFV